MPLLNLNIQYTLPAQKKTVETEDTDEAELTPPSPSDYMIIADENLFHPERKIPPEKKEEQQLPKPEFVLYGTMILDNISYAYLEDQKAPRVTPGRGKRQIALRKGETLSGFKLKEVDVDKVVMVRGEDTMTVAVNDPRHPKTREAVTTPAASGTTVPPSQAPARPAVSTRTQRPTIPPLTPARTERPTQTRAPMTPADEKAVDFFKR